ncbi:pentapeptide repeat-containing protein [Geitlerinema splendidum]|nr:pentapeptide repeat-containing protein [Geitlerinema splendidum]
MSRFRDIIPLGLIFVAILLGSGYWFNQQQRLETFRQQVESLTVNQNSTVEPKDYAALRRDLIVLQNTLNGSAFQLFSSLFFFVTAYTAWLNFKVSDKKQVSERFAKAIEQLASSELTVRVGGIFALEQIAQTSPDEHWVVIEVLASYIREQSLKGKSIFKPSIEEIQQDEYIIQAEVSVSTDIQAALTVISKRNSGQDPKGKVIDISFCDIRGADLRNAKLSNADLSGTKLSRAKLSRANLSKAKLNDAFLDNANLEKADLQDADLTNARLEAANLEKADLQNADLTNAQLEAANLQGAKLNRAKLHFVNLTNSKLQSANFNQSKLRFTNLKNAVIDKETKLDEKWKKICEIHTNGAKNQKFDDFDFSDATLIDADFEGASLKNTNFNGADLCNANFKNAHLDGASFEKTIIGPKLDRAKFDGACLKKAIFKEVSLKYTNFKAVGKITNLSDVTFEDVNLSDAIFEETLLEKAKFTRCILQNVNFRCANLSEAEFNHCSSYSKETNFQKAILNKAVFAGSLGFADFRNSNHQEADLSNADASSAQF